MPMVGTHDKFRKWLDERLEEAGFDLSLPVHYVVNTKTGKLTAIQKSQDDYLNQEPKTEFAADWYSTLLLPNAEHFELHKAALERDFLEILQRGTA